MSSSKNLTMNSSYISYADEEQALEDGMSIDTENPGKKKDISNQKSKDDTNYVSKESILKFLTGSTSSSDDKNYVSKDSILKFLSSSNSEKKIDLGADHRHSTNHRVHYDTNKQESFKEDFPVGEHGAVQHSILKHSVDQSYVSKSTPFFDSIKRNNSVHLGDSIAQVDLAGLVPADDLNVLSIKLGMERTFFAAVNNAWLIAIGGVGLMSVGSNQATNFGITILIISIVFSLLAFLMHYKRAMVFLEGPQKWDTLSWMGFLTFVSFFVLILELLFGCVYPYLDRSKAVSIEGGSDPVPAL